MSAMKSNYKNTDSNTNQSGSSMHFWGVCCESGKQYAQVVGQRFRITMAVLDPKSFSKEETDKTVSLVVIRGGIEYLLCVLKHGEIHQVNLNLIFDKGENVVFYINGHGKVYLSGYQLTDSEYDVLNDENGYLCPLVEVKSPKSKSERKAKVSKTLQKSESETPKSKKKAKVDKKVSPDERTIPTRAVWNAFVNQNRNGEIQVLNFNDEDDDESDEDYSIGEEDSESDDEDDSEEDIDEEEIECEEVEEEGEEEEEEEEEKKLVVNSKGSLKKRKLTQVLEPQKRPRNDKLMNTFNSVQNSEDVIILEDNDDSSDKDSSDFDAMNTSIGNTPMPKKQINIETSSEKKKSKKKKRLSEISNLSDKSVKGQQKSPAAENTPNKAEKTPCKSQKLEGGIEIQDVVVGKGPLAVKGKMVHVFYVGRFQDKKIFDSRLPGKKPFSFKLGAQQVIKGWDIGLQGMRVGGKRKLKVPSNLGYGNSAMEGIPPNSTLYFVVELQAVS